MSFLLPNEVITALTLLNLAGEEAYLVGGCVRDYLRGVAPHDFDITTSARPEKIAAVFKDFRTIETGIKHGTVTVLIEGTALEITTYRIDGDYRDKRHPDSVSFTENLLDDLSRRDFTVNAMAYHPKGGIIDPFGGREDLEHRCIRAVGEAERRFMEDALRILRALRFSSTLGFTLEEKTAEAARKKAENLSYVSAERIREELCKLLLGEAAEGVLSAYGDILSLVAPEWKKTQKFSVLPPVLTVRLAALTVDVGEEALSAMLDRLRFDNGKKQEVIGLHKIAESSIPEGRPGLRKLLFLYGEDITKKWLTWQRALSVPSAASAAALLKELVAGGDCHRLSDLAIKGADLLPLCRGKTVGECLEHCLFSVMEEELPNEKEALLKAAKAFLQENTAK